MEFDVINSCTHTIIVFLISLHLHKYALALLEKYPPQTKANLLTMPSPYFAHAPTLLPRPHKDKQRHS